jgi:superfamily II DNA/RNA helicase
VDQQHPQPPQQQPQDESAGGATRSQHVVYTLPQDWALIPQFLAPALERVDPSSPGPQLLVVTPDAETAHAVAEAALALRDASARPLLVPVTRPERVARLARVAPPLAVAGAPDALGALVRGAALKLDTVRAVIFAWADAITASPSAAELETVLAELPKDAARVLVAAEQTDAVEAFIERHLRRPRRVAPDAPAS